MTPKPPNPPTAAAQKELLRSLAGEALSALRGVQHLAKRAFEPLGLSLTQVLVLEMIGRGVDRPKALAEGLETLQSAVSSLLADLEGRELVARHSDPLDRRVSRLQLTEQGRAQLMAIGEAWLNATEAHLGDIDPSDLHAIARVMRRLSQTGVLAP